MNDLSKWRHKEEWKRDGEDFLIVVSRHLSEGSAMDGPHRWCVYAYLYPAHPHFARFDKSERMWQEAATCMPLHGGPSLLRHHFNNEGAMTSIQVGADYNHLYDDRFTHQATPEEAPIVFWDANNLFGWLEARSKSAEAKEAAA